MTDAQNVTCGTEARSWRYVAERAAEQQPECTNVPEEGRKKCRNKEIRSLRSTLCQTRIFFWRSS